MRKNFQSRATNKGFTFVELLVTLVIGVGIIAAAVIGFSSIANAPQRVGKINVDIGTGNHNALYGTTASYVTMGPNPNYFEGAKARAMRDRLMTDISSATAVFALGRNTLGGARAPNYSVAANWDFRMTATPGAFRDFLVSRNSALSNVYPANQFGALGTTNLSIFVIGGLSGDQMGATTNKLFIQATYEVDFLSAVSPPGTFASVRRYSTNTNVPTDYYHLFYPDDMNDSNPFRPLGVHFERTNMRTGIANDDKFRIAKYMPFTFVWWPDPLVSYLSGRPVLTGNASTARGSYANMGRRTSFFFVLPTFPGQYAPAH